MENTKNPSLGQGDLPRWLRPFLPRTGTSQSVEMPALFAILATQRPIDMAGA